MAITDHVPPGAGGGPTPRSPERRPGPAGAPAPLTRGRVLRVPGLEFSPPGNHYLVLGLDPEDVPDVTGLTGWPRPASYVSYVSERPGAVGFIAHPDDEGNPFLRIPSYRWEDWSVEGYTGIEVWNLSTDWSRRLRDWRDLIRAWAAGLYRVVPPPHPATLARWDRLARRRPVPGIAGTDAHAQPVRWCGLPFTVLPYERAFGTLQTAVWVPQASLAAGPEAAVAAVVEALGRGRSFMLNRAWGHPAGFTFQARDLGPGGGRYLSGDTVPDGRPVRFEVSVPEPAWIRLVRNGEVVANTFGRELAFEPLGRAPAGSEGDEQDAWRVEAWASGTDWTRTGTGFFLWILSNFIYQSRGEEVSAGMRSR